MKWTETFIPTLREEPAEAEIVSHRLLLKAGYIRKLAAGIYNYLPLMQRTLLKISNIVREEMNNAGAIEILMPVLHPAELWQATGRWDVVGKEQMRMKDRNQRDYVLGGTHEEVVTFLLKGEVRSYRQLPLNLYQIQVKFRDEIRPRFGLMRGREFYMKDAYSFDIDEKGLSVSYQKMVDAYFKIFSRCGMETKKVEADTGAMGGKLAHEFMVLVDTAGGESTIFYCHKCDYAANQDKASSIEIENQKKDVPLKNLEKVSTPNAKTVEEVTSFLGVSSKELVKTLLYKADGNIVAALIRGDRQINEIKLKNALGCLELEMVDTSTIEKVTGARVGFTGPVGLKNVKLIADTEIPSMRNSVTGANIDDHHILNVNWERDFKADVVTEIRTAVDGELCPQCQKSKVSKAYGIEVGNTFMLGIKYSEALGAKFLDKDGKEKPFIMGSYGVGITRTAQAAVEKYNDKYGIIWPSSIAPFQVEILPINMSDEKQTKASLELYEKMQKAGLEVLIDDRDERAGVKFNDADLIGLPIRITIGDKFIKQNKVELQIRRTRESVEAEIGSVIEKCKEVLRNL